MTPGFSDYIVYVDESGDHGLESVDPHYPVFVLAFCVVHKQHYMRRLVAALGTFKFRHFGHDMVVLHERDIRKEQREFRFADRLHRQRFLEELTNVIAASEFTVVASAIDKCRLRVSDQRDSNPYHLALGFCLEALGKFLQQKAQGDRTTHVVVECRGKKEDGELATEFRRICEGDNCWGRQLPLEIVFADKKSNACGLQLADLVARPIGLSVLRPRHANRAFEVVRRKLFCGLLVFPPSEKRKAPVDAPRPDADRELPVR